MLASIFLLCLSLLNAAMAGPLSAEESQMKAVTNDRRLSLERLKAESVAPVGDRRSLTPELGEESLVDVGTLRRTFTPEHVQEESLLDGTVKTGRRSLTPGQSNEESTTSNFPPITMFNPKRRSITMAQADFAGILAYSCTIPGTVLCFLVLVAYAITACSPVGRPHLDRVTFRLLTYAIVFNVLYGIAFSVTASQIKPGPLCTFGAFAVNFTLTISSVLTTCIAVNLQFVLVHNIKGKTMEKYYYIVTAIISIGLTVPAYALGQFGFQTDNATCWFKNPDHNIRLRWLIGSQSFWMLFLATIETICSTRVLWRMVRAEIMSWDLKSFSKSTYRTTSSSKKSAMERTNPYRSIVIRIACYPIVSMLINYSTAILDIYQTIFGLRNQLDFRLLVLDLVLYGLRTAVYGLLAMGDPSFIRAVRAIRASQTSSRQRSRSTTFPTFAGTTSGSTPGPLAVNIELERVTHKDVGFEVDSYVHADKSVTELRRNGVHVVIPPMADGARDVLERTELKLAEEAMDRDFQRQL